MDIEEDKQEEVEDEGSEDLETRITRPQTDNDFMAGAILANGIVFVWMQALSIFRETASRISLGILVDISYIIYIFAGYISVRQVTKRVEKGHLRAGLKTAGYSTIMGLLIIYTMTNEANLILAATLGVCYVAGGILGSYMEIKARLRKLRVEASS